MRSKLQNRLHLFARNAELLHQFVNAHVLKIVEHQRNRRTRAAKNPRTAALARHALHGRALRPIEICHAITLLPAGNGSGAPWINDVDPRAIEVAHVSGGQSHAARANNGCDLGIQVGDWQPLSPSSRNDASK